MKEGEEFIIKEKPFVWSSAANGKDGRNKVEFPYTSTIVAISYNGILDSNGWGWSLKNSNVEKKKIIKRKKSLNINFNLI